jgi:CelD/BcsL family acetyltransferase involved in cellulose biosynthesis
MADLDVPERRASTPLARAPGQSLRAHVCAGLTSEIVVDLQGIRALAPDYQHLYRVTGNTLPFALQEWHLTWCEHFLHRSPHIEEQPLFCVVRNDAAECVALFPLILSRWHRGPLKLATVALVGADPGLTEIRGPLVESGYERTALRAVHQSLAKVQGWDWIEWSGMSGELADAMRCETTPQWYSTSDDCVVDLPASWEQLRAGLGRNARESLRHCYNSLRRAGHRGELIVARSPEEVRRSLERLLELHTARALMPRGARHPDFFAARPARTFLFDLCNTLALRDAVRVFQLRIGSEVVAARIGFIVGDSIYLYYSGFDPAWARFGVMTTTMAEAFKYAIANGLGSVNLSPIAERSKLRWRPRVVRFHSALVRGELMRSRLLLRAYRLAVNRRASAPTRLLRNLWAQRNWD